MRRLGRPLRLPGGRRLGYDDYGPHDGTPILLFHGTPSSRCGWYIFAGERLAETLSLRIIAPDRPGLGLSTYQQGRRIADWPADVMALADGLGIDRFAVLGYSGGGPYAVACALQIPERLSAAGIVGGTGPYDAPGAMQDVDPAILFLLILARDRPRVAQRVFALLGSLARRAPRSLIAQAMAALPGPDRDALAAPEVQQAVVAAFLEALRPGPRGVRLDTALMASPWGFDPRGIAMPVRLWHGEEDHFVAPAMVRRLAEALPAARVRCYPHEGHVSLLTRYGEEIVGELAAAARAALI
ncbi:MAG TPA: alpha/beta hydrolase [Anaerolineae bacterium]|nr:alpha/beta hydrolase [Anaerolineae bacterium]HOQ99844.1 alpha/beta hydrolase [Anaerolineae bacterium]HPL29686.1 alpha/beta hydrolase [Anaerolineae bacterium]